MSKHTLYKIFYGNQLVYIGRTNQSLMSRIRGHVMNKPMHRIIALNCISKIEYHEFDSEADMFLYEIYYILLHKPPLNVDDKSKDLLTVKLPPVDFKELDMHNPLFQKWKKEIENKDSKSTSVKNDMEQIQNERRKLI